MATAGGGGGQAYWQETHCAKCHDWCWRTNLWPLPSQKMPLLMYWGAYSLTKPHKWSSHHRTLLRSSAACLRAPPIQMHPFTVPRRYSRINQPCPFVDHRWKECILCFWILEYIMILILFWTGLSSLSPGSSENWYCLDHLISGTAYRHQWSPRST